MSGKPEPVELEDIALYAMNNIPGGFMAVGKANVPAGKVLQKLDELLDGFYGNKNLLFMAPNLNDMPIMRSVPCAVLKDKGEGKFEDDADVRIVYYGTDVSSAPLVRDADYAVAWVQKKSERFGVYFNMKRLGQSEKERDDFLEHARKEKS